MASSTPMRSKIVPAARGQDDRLPLLIRGELLELGPSYGLQPGGPRKRDREDEREKRDEQANAPVREPCAHLAHRRGFSSFR